MKKKQVSANKMIHKFGAIDMEYYLASGIKVKNKISEAKV